SSVGSGMSPGHRHCRGCLALARLQEELRRAPSPEPPMLPLPPEQPTVLRDVLLSALRVRLLIERGAPAEEVVFPRLFSAVDSVDEAQRGLLVDQPRVRSLVLVLPPGLRRPIPRRPPERGVDLRTSSPRNPGEDGVGCGEDQYWWETSRLEVKFEKGTDNEQRARLSDAPLALRSDDLRVAAKAVDVGCGEVRSWCAVVMVDELGKEWTDEKLCRVMEDVPTYGLPQGRGMADPVDGAPPIVSLALSVSAATTRLLGTGRGGAAGRRGAWPSLAAGRRAGTERGQVWRTKIRPKQLRPVNTSCDRQAKPTPRGEANALQPRASLQRTAVGNIESRLDDSIPAAASSDL
ncbi:hypothetical protein THAOC_33182, partial [Thalassiosira oceanica]